MQLADYLTNQVRKEPPTRRAYCDRKGICRQTLIKNLAIAIAVVPDVRKKFRNLDGYTLAQKKWGEVAWSNYLSWVCDAIADLVKEAKVYRQRNPRPLVEEFIYALITNENPDYLSEQEFQQCQQNQPSEPSSKNSKVKKSLSLTKTT